MSNIEILGIVSAAFALVAFVLNQYGKLHNDDFLYDFLNFLSGVGLVIYAVSINGVPFIITNSVWAIVSGIDVVKYLIQRAMGKTSKNPK